MDENFSARILLTRRVCNKWEAPARTRQTVHLRKAKVAVGVNAKQIPTSTRRLGLRHQPPFPRSAFSARTTAMIVFQFLVVAGVPRSLSSWPR